MKISLNNVDLVCGGPPCQGFSMANRQRIIDDPRNNLYKAYLKFLQKVHPKFFIMENVKGMANKIDEILLDFNTFLGNDYNIHYSILNAKDFGLPQNRERFFIIGNRIGVDSESIFNDIRAEEVNELFVLKDALNSLPTLKPKNLKNDNSLENKDVGYYITKHRYDESNYLKFINERSTDYLFNHKNRYNNQRDIDIFTRLPQGQNSLHHSIADIMPYSSRNHMFKDKYFKLDNEKVCKTITSHMKFDCNMYIHHLNMISKWESTVPFNVLWESYVLWCDKCKIAEFRRVSQTIFGRYLAEIYIKRRKKNGINYELGTIEDAVLKFEKFEKISIFELSEKCDF